jgi:predicted transport protein
MTAWDLLNNVIAGFPFVVTALFFLAALVALGIFIAGFSKHGIDFIKHGFKQKGISDLGEKIDGLDVRLSEKINDLDVRLSEKMNDLDVRLSGKMNDLDVRLSGKINELDVRLSGKINDLHDEFHTELEVIKVNHFGHLKKYLTVLNGILLDKEIIDNESKARLDNELSGM